MLCFLRSLPPRRHPTDPVTHLDAAPPLVVMQAAATAVATDESRTLSVGPHVPHVVGASAEGVTDDDDDPPSPPGIRVVSLRLNKVEDGPPRPAHLRNVVLGVSELCETGYLEVIPQGAVCVHEMQYAVCSRFRIWDEFQDLLCDLWKGTVPRELTVDRLHANEARVVWHAVNRGGHLFPIDVTMWCLPGNVRMCHIAAIRAMRTTRKRAFDQLIDAIEGCSDDLPSAKFLKLYNSAQSFHEVIDALPSADPPPVATAREAGA